MQHSPKQKLDSKPSVQALFLELLKTAGVDDRRLARRIKEGLDATVVARETLYAKREVLTDFSERREMVELVLRLKGLLVDKHEVEAGPTLAELLEESFRPVEKPVDKL